MALLTFSISTGLEASTVTPGSTAPEASRTVPVIDVCACAAAGSMANSTSITHRRINREIGMEWDPVRRIRVLRKDGLKRPGCLSRASPAARTEDANNEPNLVKKHYEDRTNTENRCVDEVDGAGCDG